MSQLTASSSKVEEIEFLQKVAKQCQSGSYLFGLFNEQMVTWVTEKIQGDELPDLFDYYTQTEKEKSEAEEVAKTAANQLRDCQKSLQISRDNFAVMDDQKEMWKNMCEAEQRAGIQLRETLNSEMQSSNIELNNQIRDGQNEIDSLKSVVEDRDAQITALKAKLYDLLVK